METRISSVEFARKVGQFADKALADPVHITKHGREHLVLMSADEYARLKQSDRRAHFAHELPPEILQALSRTDDIAPESRALNHEAKDWDL